MNDLLNLIGPKYGLEIWFESSLDAYRITIWDRRKPDRHVIFVSTEEVIDAKSDNLPLFIVMKAIKELEKKGVVDEKS